MPQVSVIVAAYNAERWIAPALESLVSQTHPDYEVIVVDDGSRDATAQVAARFPVEVIRTAHRGVGPARAEGAAVARGDYLVFIDADDIYAADFVEEMVAPLRRPSVNGTFPGGGAWLNPTEGLVPGWLYIRFGLRTYERKPFGREHAWPKAVRRDVLERIGGYPRAAAGEDRILGSLTGPALVVHSARWWYRQPSTVRDVFAKSRWHGREHLFAEKRGPLYQMLPPVSVKRAIRLARIRRPRAACVRVLFDAGCLLGFIESRLFPGLRDLA